MTIKDLGVESFQDLGQGVYRASVTCYVGDVFVESHVMLRRSSGVYEPYGPVPGEWMGEALKVATDFTDGPAATRTELALVAGRALAKKMLS
jgi:hypothetical protein